MRNNVAIVLLGLLMAGMLHAGDAPETVLFREGRKALEEGRYVEAEKAFREVLQKNTAMEPMWTRNNLGFALHKLSKHDDASKIFAEAIALPAKDHHPKLFINAIQNELARNNKPRAQEISEQGTKEFPEDAWLWDNLAWVQTLREDRTAASKSYDLACKIAIKSVTPSHKTAFALPFQGAWLVRQGNGGDFSHRSLSARYAWDLEGVNPRGESSKPDAQKNEDYFGFGRDICAAADGKVVEWLDGVADNVPGTVNPASARGNHIILQHADGEFTCYYHLQRGSIEAKLGQEVKRGQRIARCGNSGYSTQPHLHFALLDDKGSSGISHPLQFSRYILVEKSATKFVETGAPKKEEIVQPQ